MRQNNAGHPRVNVCKNLYVRITNTRGRTVFVSGRREGAVVTNLIKMAGRALYVLLTAAAVATADMRAPLPGTVNDIEGQATIDGEDLSASSAGQAVVDANRVLDTGRGKVELLLTPGAFLRVGDGSELRMVSPNAPKVAFELVKGGPSWRSINSPRELPSRSRWMARRLTSPSRDYTC
jgi:hypothetical protein